MAKKVPVSITITSARDKLGPYLTFTTWGIVDGSYGSRGHVRVPLDQYVEPTSVKELADLVLTALYGMDYRL